MTLYEKVMKLYPELKFEDFLTTITLQNDSNGSGDYIAKWEHPIYKKPTNQELEIVN